MFQVTLEDLANLSIPNKASPLLSFQLNSDPPLPGDITQPRKSSKYKNKNTIKLVTTL